MRRIAIINDRSSALQEVEGRRRKESGGGLEIPKKRARERAGHGKCWEQFAGAAWRGSARARGNEAGGERGRRMSPVAVGAEEKRVTRCWVGLWDPQESRGAEMRCGSWDEEAGGQSEDGGKKNDGGAIGVVV